MLQFDELDPTALSRGLSLLSFKGIDDADIYLQRTVFEHWGLCEHKIKNTQYETSAGLGVRAVLGSQTGFAYSDSFTVNSLTSACQFARQIRNGGNSFSATPDEQLPISDGYARGYPPLYPPIASSLTLSAARKIELLHLADDYAYSLDSRVCDVCASFSASDEEIMIMRLDGFWSCDVRPLVRFDVSVVVEEYGRREKAYCGGGGRGAYSDFFDEDKIREYVKKAVDQAIVNLSAREAPAGKMPVVLGNGWTGILLHEAVGHGLEGDFNRKGSSLFSGKIGEKVCSEICTVVDDGTLYGRRGSLTIDDEGTPSARNVLIENGVLKNYMQDRLNARLMKLTPTGNGRRESYKTLPMPRMTNTFLLAGSSEKEEMIRSVKRGIYAEQFGGGQVDISNGQFVFAATSCYLIEDGKITSPLKGATLIGNGLEVMQKISMVGNDLELDNGIGSCGKNGQTVAVGVGMPSVKIDELTVGGTDL